MSGLNGYGRAVEPGLSAGLMDRPRQGTAPAILQAKPPHLADREGRGALRLRRRKISRRLTAGGTPPGQSVQPGRQSVSARPSADGFFVP